MVPKTYLPCHLCDSSDISDSSDSCNSTNSSDRIDSSDSSGSSDRKKLFFPPKKTCLDFNLKKKFVNKKKLRKNSNSNCDETQKFKL